MTWWERHAAAVMVCTGLFFLLCGAVGNLFTN